MNIEKAYDSWSIQYDSNKNKTRDLDRIVTQKVLEDISFNNVLELGCGTGKNTEWLLKIAQEILAVDFSEKMMGIAKAKISDNRVNFQIADINRNWNWTKGQFDLITCNLILEHIEDLDPIFQKAASKLNPGGYFFISELHPYKQYAGTKARFETDKGRIELRTYTHHISDFTSAAKIAGFKIERIDEWFDEGQQNIPRLISFLFYKP